MLLVMQLVMPTLIHCHTEQKIDGLADCSDGCIPLTNAANPLRLCAAMNEHHMDHVVHTLLSQLM